MREYNISESSLSDLFGSVGVDVAGIQLKMDDQKQRGAERHNRMKRDKFKYQH